MSPKSLDPLSQRKNDSAAAESMPSVPRGVDATKVLEKAQATVEARKEAQAKSKRRVIFGGLLVGLLVFLIGAGYLFYSNSDGVKYEDYAFVGGKDDDIKVTKQLSEDIKKSLEQKAQKEKSQINPTDETEKKIAIWAALQEYAQETGVTCSKVDVISYLRSQRKVSEKINVEQYYILNEQAGRPREVVDFQDQSDCLEAKLKDKIITQREYSALTIRWDYFYQKNDEKTDEAAENRIKSRFENDFLPLYKAGATKEEIAKKSDSSYLLTPEEMVAVDRRDDGFLSSFNLYQNLLEAKETGARFKEYTNEGESNYPQLQKLSKAGDYTPVFRSSTGYYAIFRLESIKSGKYDSYQQMIDAYQKKIKLSLGTEFKRHADKLGASIWSLAVKVAQAAENCLTGTNHRITYFVRVENSVTGEAVSGLDLKANTDRSRGLCDPFDGAFEGDQAGISAGSFMGAGWYNQTVTDLIENGRDNVFGYESDAFALDCNGPSWRFSFQGFPANYTFSNAPGSVYGCHQNIYFCPSMTINHGSAYGFPYFDVPYSRGVNGDFFTLLIKVDPAPPPTPLYTIQGYKIDRYANPNGQYSNAGVDVDGWQITDNPFYFTAVTANQSHTVTADNTADWDATGWLRQVGSGTPETGSGRSLAFGNQFEGTVWDMRWYYEPKPSTIQAGILVRDPATGTLSNPCNQSGYQAGACDNAPDITITRRFALPSGTQKSYTAGPTTVTPGRSSNGSADVAGLYADDKGPAAAGYTVSAANIPAGWRIVSTVQCGLNTDRNTCYTSAGQGGAASQFVTTLTAWRYRPVFFVLEPNQIIVKGDKKGPGTFNSNQNSDTTNLGVGTIDVAGQVVSGNNQAGAWNRAVNYNSTSGTYGVRAVAPVGWQIRGYAYCISAAQISSCASDDATAAPNNQTQGRIILEGNGQTEHTVAVNYQGTTPSINGVAIPTGGQVWVTFFFKPTPVTIQVRGKIDMQGGNTSANTDLNPCNYNDYKRNICTDVEVRPVRMNTVGVANTATPGADLGDPAGGYGNCASKDYVPTKPGYDYGGAANTGFYCTTEGGNNRITQAQFLAGQGPLRYGYTMDARTGQISQNGSSSENNLAIVRNVYPGKYSFRHTNGPEYNNESAYDISQSTCAVGQADCSSSVAPNADISGCLLNHRRKAEFTAISQVLWWTVYTPIIGVNNPNAAVDPNGQNYCTIMWSGAPGVDNWSGGGTPESWNVGGNTPRVCAFIPTGGWAYWPNWDGITGQYGINAQGNGPCAYRKDSGAGGINTYSMGVPVGTEFREQTFYYAPKFKLSDVVLACDDYSATLVYMPDPSRPVTSYFRIDNRYLEKSLTDNSPLEYTTTTSGPDAYKVMVPIPKYNGDRGVLLKDGRSRAFEQWARYSSVDPDLTQGYPPAAANFSAGGWKYTPTRLTSSSLKHVCTNDATCNNQDFQSQLNAISVLDADDPQANKLYVRIQNTGKSFWMRSFSENGLSRTTGHQLIVTGGTITSVNGSQGWEIGSEELLMKNGTHVYPINVKPDINGVDDADDAELVFEITPEPPADGGAKYVLGFQMAQDGVSFGTACEGDLDIKVSYKPWLRVQNGNVTALGQILTQPDGARGVFKTESSYTTPYKGSVQMSGSGTSVKPALNLHSQFVVASEGGGANFCSTNFYMLGFSTDPNYNDNNANKPQQNRNCSFGELSLNIEQTKLDQNGEKVLDDEPIITEARRNFSGSGTDDAYGQCVDTGNNPEEDGGPFELSPPQKYYRTWAPDSTYTAQNLNWNDPTGPLLENQNGRAVFGRFGNPFTGALKLVNIDNAPTGRPCPTLFRLTTSVEAGVNANLPEVHRPLGGFTVGAGRSTILSDSTVYITNDITAETFAGQYQFKRRGVPDTAGLNALPNLGIIADGDIVIASNVKKVDASLYATGRIITCDKYNLEAGMDENSATKEDKGGTTGSKWIRRSSNGNTSLDSSPLENENDNPSSLVAEPPNADNQSAKQCANNLVITGSATASKGFTFGRNYIDFAGMVARWNDAQAGAFSQPQAENGKFCNLSTIPGIQRLCTVLGARRDFDSPDIAPQGYLLEYRSGWPQNYYTGGPSEEIIGNGLASFLPPPGLENVNGIIQSPKYFDNTAKPRF